MSRVSSSVQYAILVGALFLVAVLGFGVFLTYLKLDVAALLGSGSLLLAIAAGTAAFFSPCSFPLLVTLLAREVGVEGSARPQTARSLRFAAALAVGVGAFLLLLGAALAAGAGPLMMRVTFTSLPGRLLRLVVGAVLILLGLLQIRGVRIGLADKAKRPLVSAQARLRRRYPSLAFALFGFGYVLAGFG